MHLGYGAHRWIVASLAMVGGTAMAQSASTAAVDDVQVCPYSANVVDPSSTATASAWFSSISRGD